MKPLLETLTLILETLTLLLKTLTLAALLLLLVLILTSCEEQYTYVTEGHIKEVIELPGGGCNMPRRSIVLDNGSVINVSPKITLIFEDSYVYEFMILRRKA